VVVARKRPGQGEGRGHQKPNNERQRQHTQGSRTTNITAKQQRERLCGGEQGEKRKGWPRVQFAGKDGERESERFKETRRVPDVDAIAPPHEIYIYSVYIYV
jgi:hypothetical protein